MKKLVIAGVCTLLLLAGLVVFIGILNLGPIIKTAVNTYGPEIVKTRVELQDVDISILSAQAKLKHFVLGNPEGFVTPEAVSVASVFMDIDETSLLKETVVIDRIEVDSPKITYEIKGRTDNFKAIMEKIKKPGTSAKKPAADPAAAEKEKNPLIRDLIIKGGRVNMSVSMLRGEVVTAALPEIHLQNIGGGEKGAPPEEVVRQVIQAVYGKIKSPELTREFAAQLKEVGITFDGSEINNQIKDARDRIEDVKTGIKGVRDQFKNMFRQ